MRCAVSVVPKQPGSLDSSTSSPAETSPVQTTRIALIHQQDDRIHLLQERRESRVTDMHDNQHALVVVQQRVEVGQQRSHVRRLLSAIPGETPVRQVQDEQLLRSRPLSRGDDLGAAGQGGLPRDQGSRLASSGVKPRIGARMLAPY